MNILGPKPLAVVALALLLGACAGRPAGSDKSLSEVLDTARQSPAYRAAGITDCQAALAGSQNQFPYQAFFAGLLDVPEAQASVAFCTALIEAVISGDFTRKEQDTFRLPAEVRGKGPLGDLLRDVMVAHERLLRRQVQSTPQSQACSCGR